MAKYNNDVPLCGMRHLSAVEINLEAQEELRLHPNPHACTCADIVSCIVPEAQRETQIERLTTPWFTFFLKYDPQPMLTQLDIPVLALFGSKDLQVPPEQNAEIMRNALGESSSPNATVEVLDGLNHLFQPAETGHPSEYGQIETTMAPEALERVSGWIREQGE